MSAHYQAGGDQLATILNMAPVSGNANTMELQFAIRQARLAPTYTI